MGPFRVRKKTYPSYSSVRGCRSNEGGLGFVSSDLRPLSPLLAVSRSRSVLRKRGHSRQTQKLKWLRSCRDANASPSFLARALLVPSFSPPYISGTTCSQKKEMTIFDENSLSSIARTNVGSGKSSPTIPGSYTLRPTQDTFRECVRGVPVAQWWHCVIGSLPITTQVLPASSVRPQKWMVCTVRFSMYHGSDRRSC